MRDGENIRAVERLDIDMMGFICWPRFVNQSLDEIQKYNEGFDFSYIQLHGTESPEFCQAVREKTGCKVIKAISISSEADLAHAGQYEGFVDLLLFDTKCTNFGGSGKQFSWDILRDYRNALPFLLSGGIGPEDAERLRQFHHDKCLGFDINSRFEIEPGIKDTEKIKQFITALRKN